MKKEVFYFILLIVGVSFFRSCLGCGGSNGPFNISDVESITARALINEGYGNVHIISEDCVNQKEDEVTYRFKAEFDYLGVKNTQSGFVYFYRNGDYKGIRLRNDLHVSN